jgi:hypothetical protein
MRSIGIPSPLRGRRLAGRSPYQEHQHSTGFVEEPQKPLQIIYHHQLPDQPFTVDCGSTEDWLTSVFRVPEKSSIRARGRDRNWD